MQLESSAANAFISMDTVIMETQKCLSTRFDAVRYGFVMMDQNMTRCTYERAALLFGHGASLDAALYLPFLFMKTTTVTKLHL